MKAIFRTETFHQPVTWLRQARGAIWPRRRLEIRHGIRIAAAGLVSYVIASALGLPQGYWAVFTAILVVQGSVGGSWKAAVDRLLGTLMGAIYGAVIATVIPHGAPVALGAALAAALIPLSLLAAFNPAYRVAPITAVILLLGSAGATEGPVRAAMLRTIEVALGGFCGLAVSLYLFPARAHALLGEAAARVLQHLSGLFSMLLGALIKPVSSDVIVAKQGAARSALSNLENVTSEAVREWRNHLVEDIDPEPIARTLRRVRNDLILIGRVAAEPLPPQMHPELIHAVQTLSAAGNEYLRSIGGAFARRSLPPGSAGFHDAMQQLLAELQHAKLEERLIALRFSLQQLESNLNDLHQRAHEFADTANRPARSALR